VTCCPRNARWYSTRIVSDSDLPSIRCVLTAVHTAGFVPDNILIDPGGRAASAAEIVLREREPRVIARYRPGIGDHGIVTITFTR